MARNCAVTDTRTNVEQKLVLPPACEVEWAENTKGWVVADILKQFGIALSVWTNFRLDVFPMGHHVYLYGHCEDAACLHQIKLFDNLVVPNKGIIHERFDGAPFLVGHLKIVIDRWDP